MTYTERLTVDFTELITKLSDEQKTLLLTLLREAGQAGQTSLSPYPATSQKSP